MTLYLKATYCPEAGSRCVQAVPLGGTPLLHALQDALVLGTKLECGIEFDFNGNHAWIAPGMDPGEQMIWLEDRWEKSQQWEHARVSTGQNG